jgi:hypothetical protein
MSTVPSPGGQVPPPQLEQQMLAWLGQQTSQMMSYLTSLRSGYPPLSPEELEAVVAQCDAFSHAYASAAPTAKALTDAGLPQFAQRLEFAQNDNRGATKLYYEMLDSAVRARATQMGIMVSAQQDATLQLLASTQYSMDVFRRAMQGIQDASNGYCYDCHIRPQLGGFHYCLEDARARGLVI